MKLTDKHIRYLKSKRGPFVAMARHFKMDWKKRLDWSSHSFKCTIEEWPGDEVQSKMSYTGSLSVDSIFHYVTTLMRLACIDLDLNIHIETRGTRSNSIFHTTLESDCYVEIPVKLLDMMIDYRFDFQTVWDRAVPVTFSKHQRYYYEQLPPSIPYKTDFTLADLDVFLKKARKKKL